MRFGLIGCGRIGGRHAAHIRARGVLAAVCDVVAERAGAEAERSGATPYVDVDAMLARERNLDVVAVCTPNGLHPEHSIKALQAGCHVLCEKPMAISVHDAGRMIQAAERSNRRLFAVKQNRFNPPVAAVKALIDEGRLGRIYSVQVSCFWNRNPDYYRDSWRGTRDLDGGTLFTQFSHFVDLLYWMLGDVREVKSYLGNFHHQESIEFEDTGVVILHFESGALGTLNFTVNSYRHNMEGSITIFAEKGTVKIGGQYLNELEYQELEGAPVSDLPVGNGPNNYGTYVGSMSNHDKVYDNLIAVLRDGAAVSTSSFEGLKTVEIISAIYRAAPGR